jgi:hypothetical protein
MYIELLEPHPDAGRKYHEENQTARTLIALKQARQVNDPHAREINPAGSGPPSTQVPWYAKPQWSIATAPYGDEIVIILRRHSEVAYFSGPPAKHWGCPDDVVKEFQRRKAATSDEARFALQQQERSKVERAMLAQTGR